MSKRLEISADAPVNWVQQSRGTDLEHLPEPVIIAFGPAETR
jgi:hypothetical protein